MIIRRELVEYDVSESTEIEYRKKPSKIKKRVAYLSYSDTSSTTSIEYVKKAKKPKKVR